MSIPICIKNNLTPALDADETYDPAVVSEQETQCGRKAFSRYSHGFLCFDHFKAQQESIPAKPRLPRRFYHPNPELLLSDDAYLARIKRLERAAIEQLRKDGRTTVLKFGKEEPLLLELVS